MINVSLTFDFNKEKVAEDGLTTDELLAPMREHAKKYGIDEPEYGVFTMDGENAMCAIGLFVVNITKKDHNYISYLNTWLFDVCGEVEDCVDSVKRWYVRDGILPPEAYDGPLENPTPPPAKVSLTFDFNKEKVERDGFTTDDLLAPMREHAKKYGIDEPEYGVFTMTGEDAKCCIGMFAIDITKRNHAYLSYLNTWLFNVCGKVEDFVITIKELYEEDGIELLDTMTSVM